MKFAFEAKAANGQDMRGEIDAQSEAEARVKLRAQRLTPIRLIAQGGGTVVRPLRAKTSTARVKTKELQIFTRQFSTLLNSGIPILQAIDSLSSGRSSGLNPVLRQISADISRGKRLADSLAEHPQVFGRFYINMTRAGEESGNLDQVLSRLAVYIEKSVKLQGKVKGAMLYPAVIMIIAGLIVTGLMIFVIPKFQSLFGQMGGKLPGLTLAVIAISDFFVARWYLLLGGTVAAVMGVRSYLATPVGKQMFDSIAIDLPVFGELIQKSSIAKFSRTLSTLLSSGVNIIESMEIAANTTGNYVIERAIQRAKDSITEGKSLTVPLLKEKYIPQMVTQMIGVGEQTGSLDAMLGRIADFYEDEVDVAVAAMTTIIEPLMMVVLGVIVAFIVIAMYLPIFQLAGQVSNG
jgi:type IV pilus assembly protein PilC